MKSNTLRAISIEETSDQSRLDQILLLIHEDASVKASEYVQSAKVDLGGE